MNRVLICVPLYNQWKFTKRLIESLLKTDAGIGYHIVFVDNGCTDQTEEMFKFVQFSNATQKNISASLIKNNQNKGFAIANNQVFLQYSKTIQESFDYYLLLNNDIIVTDGWLKKMVDNFYDENVGIVGCKLLLPGVGKVQHAGVYFDEDCPYHKYFLVDKYDKRVSISKNIEAVTGACMMVRSDLYHSVGGLDENYWCGYEDIDLCLKVKREGYSVFYEADVEVYHFGSMSEGRYAMEDQNFNLFIQKWFLRNKNGRKK